ncbi:hypothetical protein H113_03966 [Trichophyton rubrum MR1459]|nr:hypothetical protein H113_03966 [Trichophyton rubrum MR1459]
MLLYSLIGSIAGPRLIEPPASRLSVNQAYSRPEHPQHLLFALFTVALFWEPFCRLCWLSTVLKIFLDASLNCAGKVSVSWLFIKPLSLREAPYLTAERIVPLVDLRNSCIFDIIIFDYILILVGVVKMTKLISNTF